MSKYLPDVRNIANEPLALLGVVASVLWIVLDLIEAIEVSGVDTWVGVMPIAVTFFVRLFVDGPNTNS